MHTRTVTLPEAMAVTRIGPVLLREVAFPARPAILLAAARLESDVCPWSIIARCTFDEKSAEE